MPALPGSADGHVHPAVENGVSYYYSAFSVDATGNLSDAAHAMGAVIGVPPPPQNLDVY